MKKTSIMLLLACVLSAQAQLQFIYVPPDGKQHVKGQTLYSVLNEGQLTLEHCIIQGGGVENYGKITLRHCIIRNNYNLYSGDFIGGVLNYGQATLEHCGIAFNSVEGGAGIQNFGHLYMKHCSVMNNFAPYGGGGMINYSGAVAVASNCEFRFNVCAYGGGAGIENYGRLLLRHCLISDNYALSKSPDGLAVGGLLNRGPLILIKTRIENNEAYNGWFYNSPASPWPDFYDAR